ncbi:fatty acid desaturase family protein [Spongisporangium articulatum]|uniref:Fatty acid desaturase family protein n=1 Tax=Spongisporangium articulatum TaxID=3362603 RepID=A0ABW8AKI9_9ACTN
MTAQPLTPGAPAVAGRDLDAGVYHLERSLSAAEVEAFGREIDALRHRHQADLGAEDAAYIRRVLKIRRWLEIGGRGLFFVGFLPPAWVAGVLALGAAKIIDNMEIGHNVMHGQYDWMRDPTLNSRTFEWDNVCPSAQWKYTHNVVHHTYTNVLRKDRDLGYAVIRVTDEQRWRPYYLGNPLYALVLGSMFEWGVALHALELDNTHAGRRTWEENRPLLRQTRRKAARQVLKDYILFPALTGPLFVSTALGNLAANGVRNVWAFAVIACGHFPDGSVVFRAEDVEGETRAAWYVRQIVSSSNISGGRLMHLMTGNLSLHVEHHLFPDLPARRYRMLSAELQEICARYGVPYKTGPMWRQVASVSKHLVRLALPPRRRHS